MYFIVSIEEATGKRSYRALPHQVLATNETVKIDRPVAASRMAIGSFPVGTVFATDRLVATGSTSYAAGRVYAFHAAAKDDIAPTEEMKHAWEAYKASHPNWSSGMSEEGTGELFAKEDPDEEKENKLQDGITAGRSLVDTLLHRYPVPTIEKDGFFVAKNNWALLLRNVEQCENTLIYGCQGLGKTELVLTLGKTLGKAVKVYDMGSMHDPMSQMLGTHRLVSDGQNTVSKFDMARFTQDIQEDCIILLDELNRAPSTTLNILFPCLDSRRMLPVEMAGGDGARNISVNPRCCFIATANIGDRHVGTLPLDPALFSRFLPIELTHLDIEDEVKLLVKRTGVSLSEASVVCKIAGITREKAEQGELSNEISPRETIRACKLCRDGFTLLEAMQMTFLPMFQRDERDIVKTIFMTR